MTKRSSSRPRFRSLRFEKFEPRELLAGDTYLVNFQFDETGTPVRHLRDVGSVFGDRGNGFNYGWSSNHTDVSRVRGLDPDARLDTLVHVHVGQYWEFALPNGNYEVTVAVGDPANNDGVHTVNVEGVSFFNAVADTNVPQFATHTVTVSDGRLTLGVGASPEKATRLDYIYIVGVPNAANSPPAAPTITEPSMVGQIVNPADFHMEAINFVDGDGNGHKSTDWEIREGSAAGPVVWQTLGIEGVERLHTHLGDGVFINSHAGLTALKANTDYVLRVRFRDDAGSVSGYAERAFHTGQSSTIFPMLLDDVADVPGPTWNSVFGQAIDLPAGNTVLSPGNPIIAVDSNGDSSYPGTEIPANAIDGTLAKYLNFGEVNSGFIVTPTNPASVVTGFQITTGNDAVERDPTTWQLYGTNAAIVSADNSTGAGESWSIIASGSVVLPSGRNTVGPTTTFSNGAAYKSYKLLFTGVKNSATANSMQIAEIQFFAAPNPAATPASLRLVGGESGDPLLTITGDAAPGNVVVNPVGLTNHESLRVIIEGGTQGFAQSLSNLTVYDEHGDAQIIYLPAISLGPNERLDLWASSNGSTYFGTSAQTAPDFSSLARVSDTSANVPFTALEPGYVVDAVAGGFQLPTNIAFVPNPGPNPSDPFFYVTELYGNVKVVSRDFSVGTYASGLLNFNPTGAFPGSGEQGVTGITVDPVSGDVFISRVTATDPLNPNGAHHPQVLRFSSTDGGRTAAATTVILNMVGETQGQSHQISNLSIGPDGKLYVHNGDGFDSSTALNLNSYRGKVLRVNLDGTAPSDNPFYNAGNGITATDYVYAYGLRNPFGGAWRAADGAHYEVENGPSVDRFARVLPGISYGWNGTDASMAVNAIYNWNPAHAPVNIAFIQNATFSGSQFPVEQLDKAFVSESGPTYGNGPQARGKRIVEFGLSAGGTLTSGPTTLVEYTGNGHGTVVGLAAGPDGLYFTELYKDLDAATPIDAGARVFRVRYVGQTPGDYTRDDKSDGLDFLAWQRGLGSTTNLSADGDRDRLVTGADLAVWQTNYGTTSAAVASQVESVALANESESLQAASGLADPVEFVPQAEASVEYGGVEVAMAEATRRTRDTGTGQERSRTHAFEGAAAIANNRRAAAVEAIAVDLACRDDRGGRGDDSASDDGADRGVAESIDLAVSQLRARRHARSFNDFASR